MPLYLHNNCVNELFKFAFCVFAICYLQCNLYICVKTISCSALGRFSKKSLSQKSIYAQKWTLRLFIFAGCMKTQVWSQRCAGVAVFPHALFFSAVFRRFVSFLCSPRSDFHFIRPFLNKAACFFRLIVFRIIGAQQNALLQRPAPLCLYWPVFMFTFTSCTKLKCRFIRKVAVKSCVRNIFTFMRVNFTAGSLEQPEWHFICVLLHKLFIQNGENIKRGLRNRQHVLLYSVAAFFCKYIKLGSEAIQNQSKTACCCNLGCIHYRVINYK